MRLVVCVRASLVPSSSPSYGSCESRGAQPQPRHEIRACMWALGARRGRTAAFHFPASFDVYQQGTLVEDRQRLCAVRSVLGPIQESPPRVRHTDWRRAEGERTGETPSYGDERVTAASGDQLTSRTRVPIRSLLIHLPSGAGPCPTHTRSTARFGANQLSSRSSLALAPVRVQYRRARLGCSRTKCFSRDHCRAGR